MSAVLAAMTWPQVADDAVQGLALLAIIAVFCFFVWRQR
jgi:hypothetical protein